MALVINSLGVHHYQLCRDVKRKPNWVLDVLTQNSGDSVFESVETTCVLALVFAIYFSLKFWCHVETMVSVILSIITRATMQATWRKFTRNLSCKVLSCLIRMARGITYCKFPTRVLGNLHEHSFQWLKLVGLGCKWLDIPA